MKRTKKGISVVLLVVCLINVIPLKSFAGEGVYESTPEMVLEWLTTYENNKSWLEFAALCTKDYGQEILKVKDGYGIKGNRSAELVYVEELSQDEIPQYALFDSNKEQKYYLIGIDYMVDNPTKFFYNGVNYRMAILVKEGEQWKLHARTDAPREIIGERLVSASMYLVDGSNDFEKAYQIMSARTQGYIFDGDMKLIENLADGGEKGNIVDETAAFFGNLRPGVSYDMACPDQRPSVVLVDDPTNRVGIYPYVLDVLPNEWVISLSPDAALAAGVVMIEQYATWNVLFYQRHPDGGYDLSSGDTDQCYIAGAYARLSQVYKDAIDRAWATSSHMHMETEDGRFFHSKYNNVSQNKSVELANNGYTYENILHYLYDGTTAPDGGYDIGTIQMYPYQYFVPNPAD